MDDDTNPVVSPFSGTSADAAPPPAVTPVVPPTPPEPPASPPPASEPAWHHAPSLPSEPEPVPSVPPSVPPVVEPTLPPAEPVIPAEPAAPVSGFPPPPAVEPSFPPLPPEKPAEPPLSVKPKKSSAGKTIALVLIFFILAVGGVFGYLTVQQGGLPFSIGKKAAESCGGWTEGQTGCGTDRFLCKVSCVCNTSTCKANSINLKCAGDKVEKYPDSTGCDGQDSICNGQGSCGGGTQPPPTDYHCPNANGEAGKGQECNSPNKCNKQGGCDPACCKTSDDCPLMANNQHQPCDIPNGNCGFPGTTDGKSCNDQGGGTHKACRDGMCVFVAGAGNNECGPGTSKPTCEGDTQPPPGTCSGVIQCPGGTKDCKAHFGDNAGYQCQASGNSACPNICKHVSGVVGTCSGPRDNNPQCATWEVCENGGCHSTAGCANDGECASGMKCINNTCTGGTGNVECNADVNGVSIKNNTSGAITVTFEWFSKKCTSSNCMCGGAPTTETQIIAANGGTLNRGISGSGCSWQSDIKVTSGPPIAMGCNTAHAGCIAGCGTTPPIEPCCTNLTLAKVLADGTVAPLTDLQVGDKIRVTVTFSGTVEDVTVRVKRGGTKLNDMRANGSKTNTWSAEFNIPSAGQYEILGFVKVGGSWK